MATLPRQLVEGYRAGRELPGAIAPDLQRLTVVGMGGSAIAADLARSLTETETELSLSVSRSAELPQPAVGGTMVAAASYSGNTWETLDAFAEAGRRGLRRIAITSGGALEDAAVRAGVPLLHVPPGAPPRSQVGFLLGGILGLLEPVFPSSLESRIADAAHAVEARWGSLASPRGLPHRIAVQVDKRIPLVFAETRFESLARRWKTQVEENAKREAGFDVLPEMLHNAVVAWDRAPPLERRSFAVILLEWRRQAAPIRARFRYLEKLLRTRRVTVVGVPLTAEDPLAALVGGVAVGDLFSLELAQRDHVDPYPVAVIDRMKKSLGGAARN